MLCYTNIMGWSVFVIAMVLFQREITVEGQSMAEEQLQLELQNDRRLLEQGVDRLGGMSARAQHASIVAARPRALEMGRQHRERLLEIIMQQQQPAQQPQPRIQPQTPDQPQQQIAALRSPATSVPDFAQLIANSGQNNCPREPPCSAKIADSKFRTADGSCNNLKNPSWGKSFISMRRFIAPEYDNGLFTPRTKGKRNQKLKSPREISRVLHVADKNKATENKDISHMAMQFAQFLDHDFTLTPIESGADGAVITCCEEDVADAVRAAGVNVENRPQCFPIEIPPGDLRFKGSCMNFVRSLQVNNANCNVVPVEQLNQLTAYIDGSQVYGSTEEEQLELRAFKGGLLNISSDNPELLPRNPHPDCVTSDPPNYCFLAGDERVDEHMALASMHTIWLREHNRIAKNLARINPHWDDERLFQETRRIVGAMLQHITYTEFLPVVLSSTFRRDYDLNPVGSYGYSRHYDPNVDASIHNAFATAAYRFGHSMIRSTFQEANIGCKYTGSILLRTSFGNTSIIHSSNGLAIGSLTRGLTEDPAMNVDRRFTPEITDFLFVDSEGNSLDLVALNLQRGRDHGLAGYNTWREWCGLSTASNFGTGRRGLVDHPPKVAKMLGNLYSHPDDIDLFSGGVTEKPVRGGLIGPTFSCILARQFQALKMGDRFWYETGDKAVRFTPGQLRQIRRANLARVICDNTDTSLIQPKAFKLATVRNKRTGCTVNRINRMNLNLWRDRTGYGR